MPLLSLNPCALWWFKAHITQRQHWQIRISASSILNSPQLQLTAQNILDLYLDRFYRFECFYTLVAALPRLERLTMRHSQAGWSYSCFGRLDRRLDVRSAPSPPPSLRNLAFWTCDSFLIHVLRWITAAPNHHITSLFVHAYMDLSEYLPLVGGPLCWICVELKGLSLFLSWTIYWCIILGVDLSKNVNLQFVELTCIDLVHEVSTDIIEQHASHYHIA